MPEISIIEIHMIHLFFLLADGSGGWNPSGCYVLNATDNETVCGCNHLTSFAILLVISFSIFCVHHVSICMGGNQPCKCCVCRTSPDSL